MCDITRTFVVWYRHHHILYQFVAHSSSGLALETAGINRDDKEGIIVNDKLQTTNGNVYAVGDCCTRYQFTHMADFMVCAVVM